jgi:hypothetical protein
VVMRADLIVLVAGSFEEYLDWPVATICNLEF